jgi:hypothetical protein
MRRQQRNIKSVYNPTLNLHTATSNSLAHACPQRNMWCLCIFCSFLIKIETK